MKALIQRVSRAQVSIENVISGKIGAGLLVFVGVKQTDTHNEAEALARKTAHLRIFPDEQDRMNLSLLDIAGAALVISQFTLHADTRKGHRPSFIHAAKPATAEQLYNKYVTALQDLIGEHNVQTGRFRASMQVELTNDGPVTIMLSTGEDAP
jgi:D-aminoacyl-tRNA deacylase